MRKVKTPCPSFAKIRSRTAKERAEAAFLAFGEGQDQDQAYLIRLDSAPSAGGGIFGHGIFVTRYRKLG
jgi:hypothetical protein